MKSSANVVSAVITRILTAYSIVRSMILKRKIFFSLRILQYILLVPLVRCVQYSYHRRGV